ncbi:MAG TPA: hypothetical protein VI752_00190 [Candidatus Paceibacterota bacterium]
MINTEKDKLTGYTWKEIVQLVYPDSISLPKDMSTIITKARTKGIGRQISPQKTYYSKDDIKKITILIKWWVFLDSYCDKSWRSSFSTKNISNLAIDSIIKSEPLTIISIFCPSYKVGIGSFGYNKHIGNTTIKYIDLLVEFVSRSKELGVLVNSRVYFSDLILENLEALKREGNYHGDLELNYFSFVEAFKLRKCNNIKMFKLSELKGCFKRIGESGVCSQGVSLSPSVFNQVNTRNRVFYKNNFGWTDSEIEDRTKIIVNSYLELAAILKKEFPDSIILWTENAFERGLIYENHSTFPMSVIYPKKDNRLVNFFKANSFSVNVCNDFDLSTFSFIDELYKDEQFPIFEHNLFHLTSYLSFSYKIFLVSNEYCQSILLSKNNEIVFFTPKIFDWKMFNIFVSRIKTVFPSFKIRIQNVSEKWINTNKEYFSNSFMIAIRSAQEVVYDLNLLNILSGKSFSNLRNLKNRLNKDDFINFRSAKSEDFLEIKEFVVRWNKTQGLKYKKNKLNVELYTLEKAIEYGKKYPDKVCFKLGFLKNNLICLYILLMPGNFKDWGILYMTKGINKSTEGGVRGSSDSAYLDAFREASQNGMTYVNDGELGSELGSASHKMKFNPSMFLRSYDVILSGDE